MAHNFDTDTTAQIIRATLKRWAAADKHRTCFGLARALRAFDRGMDRMEWAV